MNTAYDNVKVQTLYLFLAKFKTHAETNTELLIIEAYVCKTLQCTGC